MLMYNLLQSMEFNLVTGFGPSTKSFGNDEDFPFSGQGVLQGSSSTAPIYNMNT
jgi:hypothetical protein